MEWFKIKSQKDHDFFLVKNYIHRIDRIRDQTEYYKCVDNCGGPAILKNNSNVVLSKNHNHRTHGIELAICGFRNKLKVIKNYKIYL